MNRFFIITLLIIVGLFRQSFAQEELLGKSFKEALSYIRSYKTNDGTFRSDYDDTLPVFPTKDCAKTLTLSRLEFEKWDNWASLEICIDSNDRVSSIAIGFHAAFKHIVMDRHDRKMAVKQLTKKFGKPKHTKDEGEEIWLWKNNAGSYEFIRDIESGACDFGAQVGTYDHPW